jgi:ABC-type lipoprotein release transport system permease subunit
MVSKIAFRNIFRQKRRTLLTTLTMFGGFVLCSFSIAFMDGSYNNVINMFTRNQLGHIQIHHYEYTDRPALYRTIDNYEEIGRELDGHERVEAWAPRVFTAGLASVGTKSAGVRIVGVDPARETAATRFDKKITTGAGFYDEAGYQALLGEGLATRLGADIGKEIVVVSQGADGSIANELYTISGLIDSGNEMDDQMTLYLRLADAQELLVLEGRVHEIVIVANSVRGLHRLSDSIAASVNRQELTVEPWQEFAKSFYDAMKADQKGNWISLVVITILVAIGVLNTVLMTVLERTREYGLMRAIGTRPRQVFGLVIIEVFEMSLLSVGIGLIVAYAVNYTFSIVGIPIPPVEYGGVTFSVMNTEINIRSFAIPLICVVLSAVFISVFPALKAARTQPAAAMRYH